jgi:transcription initiation factor TFIID subunit 2
VSIGKQNVEFAHQDSVTELQLSGATETEVWDCHRHLELRRKLYSALQEGDEGELAIAIPKELVYQTISEGAVLRTLAFVFMLLTNFFGFVVGSTSGTPIPGGSEFKPIVIKIEYSLRNPADGFEFILPDEMHPNVSC